MPDYRKYLRILGLNENATLEDIKRAYKNLAKKYHPDVSKEKDAENKFKEIQEAYNFLSENYERIKNSRSTNRMWDSSFSFDGSWGGIEDIFRDIFGGEHFTSGFENYYKAYQRRRVTVNVNIELEFLYKGGELNLEVEGKEIKVKIEPYTHPSNFTTRIQVENTIYIIKFIGYSNKYKVAGLDIYTEVEVDYKKIVEGGEIEVDHISGEKLTVEIPPYKGRADNIYVRIPNKGWPLNKETGNFVIKVTPVF